ncbi:MAG: DUF4829 domain-containing protein [Desulfovibrio sp.]|jgi:hypothetical protein|nr:DUF4829 domain-containing protein [Desulfovibrio sp.]
MENKTKKKALAVVCLILAGLLGFFGTRYYLDNIKMPEVSPRQVVEDYFAALKAQDYDRAYGLISLRHYNNTINQFKDRVSMYSPEMELEIKDETITEDTAVVVVRVLVPLGFGPYISDTNMDLVRDKRVWKIIHP